MSRAFFRRVMAVLICAQLAMPSGCHRNARSQKDPAEAFDGYADLPGLQATHHHQLKAEYAMLVAERATPKLLDQDAGTVFGEDNSSNLVNLLSEQFNSSAVEYGISRTDRIFDGDYLQWDSVNLMQASQFARQYEKQRSALREALRDGNVFVRIELSRGVGMNIEFIDEARRHDRLEMFHAADQVVSGDLNGAIGSLQVMFLLQEKLGAAQHVVARLSAAKCRRESQSLVQAIASHASVAPEHLQSLRQMFAGQLTAWPDDSRAWVGDRAQGLHMYEMIRDGHLMSLLTEEEFVKHTTDRSLEAFLAAADRSIDSDEYFYLRWMRSLIDDCDRPYHEREATFDRLRNELKELQQSPEYPLIADRLLLKGIQQGQQQQALDRAWVEAWTNALTLAVEERSPPFATNPLTGRSYNIAFENGNVIVSRIDPSDIDARVLVPLHRTERVSRGLPLLPPLSKQPR